MLHILHARLPVARPRWDGTRVTFQIMDKGRRVDCAISRAALLDIAQRSHLSDPALLACFLSSRTRIEAIARAKWHARSRHAKGILHIWSEDTDPSPPSIPAVACAAMPSPGA